MSISTKMSLFLMLLVISHISALPVPTKDTSSDLATTFNDTTSDCESEEGGVRGGGLTKLGGKSETFCKNIIWKFCLKCVLVRRPKLTAFLLSIFFGGLGVDWFYLSLGSGPNPKWTC